MTQLKKFYIVNSPATAELTEKGSKFLAYLFPVHDEADIKNKIQQIKSLHPKAKHWCFAWRLDPQGTLFKSNDDGEPSGTAGKPILNQIDSSALTNVLIVVVRYFGGTLLGTSGLIKAYKEVSKKCIEVAAKAPLVVTQQYIIKSNSAKIQTLIGILKELEISIQDYTLEADSTIIFQLPLEDEELYFRKIKSKLEKTNLNQVENPKQLKECILISIHG